MARKRKDDEYNQLGSEKPFADLSPGLNAEVVSRARMERQVRGDATIDDADPNATGLRSVRAMRAENNRKASQTQELRGKIADVQTGNTAPNWAGYLQGRGVSDDRIRAARALEGRASAPAQPVNAVGPKMDPVGAQAVLKGREAYQDATGVNVADSAISQRQRQDPAYRARVESAREASALDQQRQRELDAIRQQVQNQRYAEALMNRGRGIQDRASASRERKDNRIATSGLGPQDRASVLLERRGQDYQRSAVQEEIAARRAEIEAQRQAEQAARRFEADQNAADRGSAEKVATIRANAPAGNRGDAEGRARRQARDDAMRSFKIFVDPLAARVDAGEASDGEARLLKSARDAMAALQRDPQIDLYEYPKAFPVGDDEGILAIASQFAEDNNIGPGKKFIVYDNSGLPFVFTNEAE